MENNEVSFANLKMALNSIYQGCSEAHRPKEWHEHMLSTFLYIQNAVNQLEKDHAEKTRHTGPDESCEVSNSRGEPTAHSDNQA